MTIEPFDEGHLEGVVELSLRAWAPVFESLQSVMEPDVYHALVPDWREHQRNAVQEVCTSGDARVWVAVGLGGPVGFVAIKLDLDSGIGEIYMIATDPDHQREGIATALTELALDEMREAGASIAMVETGGDPGHAPARSAYERFGFKALPIARYFKRLQ